MGQVHVSCPVRVGVFRSVNEAAAAVRGLVAAGFAPERISVLCSDAGREATFRVFEHEHPAGTTTPRAAAAGGVVGAIVAGVVTAVEVAVTGDPAIAAVGPFAVGTGAGFGSFVGAMVSRGVEHETANFYDQALRRGQILVAAEIASDAEGPLLVSAERVLREAGAAPVALPEG